MAKSLPGVPANLALNGNTNVDLINNTTSYAGTVASDAQLRTQIWSELVKRDAREKNVLKDFIGGEGSGKPIVEKRDLAAGGSDKVTFTTVAPIRGQGVLGEAILKNSTESLKFGTFPVEVDLIRHAVSWTQVLKLMRFTGKTLDQLSSEVMSEWYARKEQDDSLYVARQTCVKKGSANTLDDYGSSTTAGNLNYANDGLSTDLLEHMKQNLIASGGEPTQLRQDSKSGHEIPGYLFFAPDAGLRPLRGDSDYLNAINYADVRSADNKLYSGEYAMWDNIMVYSHNNVIDTAAGRQGSPLAPTYFLKSGETLAINANNLATFGTAGSGDYFANFRKADLDLISGDDQWDDAAGDYYFLAISLSGVNRGKVKHYKYTGISADKSQLTGVTALATNFVAAGNGIANTANAAGFTAGDMLVQADAGGCPIAYGLMMGKNALYYAKGAVDAEQIFHYDDFANSGNQAHLNSIGIQGVRGWRAYEDTDNRVPGLQMIELVRQIPVITAA